MVVATGLLLTVIAAIFGLMTPVHGMFAAQLESLDMQQRLRAGTEILQRDLLMAGAGRYSGAMTGSMGNYLAPILPYRIGKISSDPAGSFFTDRITVMYVPQTPAQTTILDPTANVAAGLRVAQQPGCPSGDSACAFAEGMAVMITDSTGFWDTFSVTDVLDTAVHFQQRGEMNRSYDAGSSISQIIMHTYWLRTDTANGTYQLMRYDGNQTDVPLADNVVGLSFEYYGEQVPPELTPAATPTASYGPAPPALGVDNAADNWGAGENCTFQVIDGVHVPRMTWLGGTSPRLVKLAEPQLKDGPWCPDSTAVNRYDADLLRIRRVRVTLRVQVASRSLRGAAGPLFARAGTSKGGERFVPDQEIKFDVTVRNLNLAR
jgi:hypothetical protein